MKNLALAAVGVLAFSLDFSLISCKKDQTPASVVPVISFKELKKFNSDSATLTINFRDGDGDIGLDPTTFSAPFNVGSKYQYNLYLVYYYQDMTGVWKPWDTNISTPQMDTLFYGYRIPTLPQTGQKSLTGEIKVRLNYPYSVPGQNIFKFKIVLIDRALHISNEIDSGPLTP